MFATRKPTRGILSGGRDVPSRPRRAACRQHEPAEGGQRGQRLKLDGRKDSLSGSAAQKLVFFCGRAGAPALPCDHERHRTPTQPGGFPVPAVAREGLPDGAQARDHRRSYAWALSGTSASSAIDHGKSTLGTGLLQFTVVKDESGGPVRTGWNRAGAGITIKSRRPAALTRPGR